MSTIIEALPITLPDGAVVEMVTLLESTSVIYKVVIVEDNLGSWKPEKRTIWQREVHFGQTDATVAGGAWFVAAAREQERIATELAYGKPRAVLP